MFEEAIKLDPKYYKNYFYNGECLQEMRLYDQAIKMYEWANKL